jgi:DNA mismatch repair protein MutS
MGARMLKRWILLPLKDINPIQERLDIVSHFVSSSEEIDFLEDSLHKLGDLERMISRLTALKISPREMVQLKFSMKAILPVKEYCCGSSSEKLKKLGEHLATCNEAIEELERSLNESAPAIIGKGETILTGISKELDELRSISNKGKDYLIEMQQRESEKTGISSLKVAFNNVFGYYIEVRNTHKDKVPEEWIRKQTLTSAERYITEELKEYEAKILGAEQKILELENQLYTDLLYSISNFIHPIQHNAQLIGKLDCLLSFAKVAIANNPAFQLAEHCAEWDG